MTTLDALTGVPETAYLSTAQLRDHVQPVLIRAHSHLPGLSDRGSMPTLLFTAFAYNLIIISGNT